MPPTQVTASTDASSNHRKEGTARDWGAGLTPHKLLPSSFLGGLEPKTETRMQAQLLYQLPEVMTQPYQVLSVPHHTPAGLWSR